MTYENMVKSKKGINFQQYFVLIIIIITVLCETYFFIKRRMIRSCQDQYGVSYNQHRKELGIPIIPANWSLKERKDESMDWYDNEHLIGHGRKTIVFSECHIDGEMDLYSLPLQNNKRRWINIEYKYKHRPIPDSVTYTYQIENTAHTISKQIADSLFRAEHINKDY